MYQEYFGLTDLPFSIAPDPSYLYLGEQHKEALGHLLYGVGEQGGFVLLTGEVGTGKTTVCRCLLQQIPDNVDIAFVVNPKQSPGQLLKTICREFKIDYDPALHSASEIIDSLNTYLLNAHAKGRNSILIIDEAQNLSFDVLEQLRLLTNLETNSKKLLQLVLLGQPELNEMLAQDKLRQLAQRITARFHLEPLSKIEVQSYVEHRLSIAGYRGTLFNPESIRLIYKYTLGVPRLINVLCDRVMLGTYATNQRIATGKIVRMAAGEVFQREKHFSLRQQVTDRPIVPAAIGLVALILIGAFVLLRNTPQENTQVTTDTAAAALSSKLENVKISRNEVSPPSLPRVVDEALASAGSSTKKKSAKPPWLSGLQSVDDNSAIKLLYRLWDVKASATITRCIAAHSSGVNCASGQLSLEKLLSFGRPVLLHLVSAAGEAIDAVLLGVGKNDVLLISSGVELYSVSKANLQRYWDGRFTMLGRFPNNIYLPVKAGDEGAVIGWINHQLQTERKSVESDSTFLAAEVITLDKTQKYDQFGFLMGHFLHVLPAELATFDDKLESEIEKLQHQYGLTESGQVDAETLFTIQAKSGERVPTFARSFTESLRWVKDS